MSRPRTLRQKLLSGSMLARVLLVIFIAALTLVPAATPTSTTARIWQQSSGYTFSLVSWHVRNLPPRLVRSLLDSGAAPSQEARLALLDRYFATVAEIGRAQAELDRHSALQAESEMRQAQQQLDRLRRQQRSLAGQVESVIREDITRALMAHDIGVRSLWQRRFVFPPLGVALQRSPQLLIVSPRDRIDRLEDVLLVPDMAITLKDELENQILRRFNLSALVEGTGGVGTFPPIVDDRSDFYYTYVTTTHEWTHNYLALYPLGRAYFKGSFMAEINEGIADTVGYEIADEIYRSYGREPPPRPTPAPPKDRKDETVFDFNSEMRQTRLTVDRLLAEGKVEEAEGYMEERRQLFVKEGHYIRKLNQAYFAFHGTYASDPGSVSPVGAQLRELRQRFPTLGGFLRAVQKVSSYDGLLALLEETAAQEPASFKAEPPGPPACGVKETVIES